MSRNSKTFRVFVSSTFSDLVEERNALQQRVWPELVKLCEMSGFRFQAIDLRWGISEQAGLDQQTTKICLQEIERCQTISSRPNFIILLGNRYGWRPLPDAIEALEFETICSISKQFDIAGSNLLREWYKPDRNAIVAGRNSSTSFNYYLRKRNLTTDEADSKKWHECVEQPLHDFFRQCIEKLCEVNDSWPVNDPRRLKYERSLTEQEIFTGALAPRVANNNEHIFAYFREVESFQDLDTFKNLEAVSLRKYVDFTDDGQVNQEAQGLLANLKAQLKSSLNDEQIRHYDADWDGATVSTHHLDKLCTDVLTDLTKVIKEEIQKFTDNPIHNIEVDAHKQFSFDQGHANKFQGCTNLLTQIDTYIGSPEPNRPLVILGSSGTGKSALIARSSLSAKEKYQNALVLERFIGITPTSVNGCSLLQSLCKELGDTSQNDKPLSSDYRELVIVFHERLAKATKDQPIIVFIDALDQLSTMDNAHALTWIPQPLPPHTRMVVSVLCDSQLTLTKLRGNSLAKADPLANILIRAESKDLVTIRNYPMADAEILLDRWLQEDYRTLTKDQRELLLSAFERCPRPLFLKLAVEEAKQWRSDTEKPEMPAANASESMLTEIIDQFFNRLSEDSNHGALLIDRALSYLIAARNGLTEDELIGILSSDEKFFDDLQRQAESVNQPFPPEIESLPVAVWVRLYSDLSPYITMRQADGTSLYTFYHRRIEEVAHKRVLGKREIAGQRHQQIAMYFTPTEPHHFFRLTLEEHQARAQNLPPTSRPVNLRMVSELPYQLLTIAKLLGNDDPKSLHWQAVTDLLTNIHFLEATVEGG